MAKLPDSTALGAINPQGSHRPIATYDTTGYARGAAAIGEGVSNLGKGIQSAATDLGAVARSQEQQQTKVELATATADLNTNLLIQQNEITNATDPADLADKYTKASEQTVQAAKGKIRNTNVAAVFEQGARDNAVKIALQAKTKEAALYKDAEVAADLEQIKVATRASLESQAPDALEKAKTVASALIDKWVDKGWIDKQTAFQKKGDWIESFVTGKLETLPKSEQVEILQGSPSRRMSNSPLGPMLDRIATENGIDPTLFKTIASIESGGNPAASKGSYKGLFQLSDEGFRKFGGQGDIYNAEANARAGAQSIKADIAAFQSKMGRPPTATELYLTHQQGQGGIAAHLSNPDAPAWQNMLSTGEGRQKGEGWAKAAIWGNVPSDIKGQFPGGVESLTSRQFVAIWDSKVNGGALARFGPIADFLSPAKRATMLHTAQTGLDQENAKRSVDTYNNYNAQIVEFSGGRSPSPPSHLQIDDDHNLALAHKTQLKAALDRAVDGDANYKAGTAKLGDSSAVWNPRDDADKKALSAVDVRDKVVSGLQASEPDAANLAVHRFVQTGMVSNDVKGSIEGMIRGGSEKQLNFAMSTLDAMYRHNPNAFAEAFDKDTAKTLVAWQSRAGQEPGAFREQLKRANDPAELKAREAAEEKGRKLVMGTDAKPGMTDDQIMSVLDDAWFSDPQKPMGTRNAPGMSVYREEYAGYFAEGYAAFDANPEAAKKFADDRIKINWAISPSGGGRVMKHAPETLPESILPTVDGKKDWMRDQVETVVKRRVNDKWTPGDPWGEAVSAEETITGRADGPFSPPVYGLVSLPGTVAEIEALKSGRLLPGGRQSPAWMLVYVDPKTGFAKEELFYFDVAAARALRQKRLNELDTKHRSRIESDAANAPVLGAAGGVGVP